MTHTLGSGEVDDVSVALEHVDLLNCLDGLHVQLLEGGLELLVVVGGSGDIASLLLSGGTLTTYTDLSISIPGSRPAALGRNANSQRTGTSRGGTAELLLEDLLDISHVCCLTVELLFSALREDVGRGSSGSGKARKKDLGGREKRSAADGRKLARGSVVGRKRWLALVMALTLQLIIQLCRRRVAASQSRRRPYKVQCQGRKCACQDFFACGFTLFR